MRHLSGSIVTHLVKWEDGEPPFPQMCNCQVVSLPLASQLLRAGSGLLAGWSMHWVTVTSNLKDSVKLLRIHSCFLPQVTALVSLRSE